MKNVWHAILIHHNDISMTRFLIFQSYFFKLSIHPHTLFNISYSQKMEKFDDFYIEETQSPFRVQPGKVQKEEYLSKLWKTQRIFCIPASKAGIYLLYNLHKNPHYHMSRGKRTEVKTKSANLEVPFIMVDKKSYAEKETIYHDTHDSSLYKKHILPIVSKIDVHGVIEKLTKVNTICKRGNIAINFGWKHQSFVPNKGINIPFNDTLDHFDRTILKQMTEAYLSSYGATICDAPFTQNEERTKNYADQLVKIGSKSTCTEIENVFESVTYAMTYCDNSSKTQLRMHIDGANCFEKGFNAVFGMYFILNHATEKNKKVRLVLLGYSRRSIYSTMIRLEKRTMFKGLLERYASYVGERNLFSLENAIPFEVSKNKEPTIITKLPFMDKCGFYSIFTSAIYDIIRICKNVFLEDIVEMVLPIGWLVTGSNYYRILSQWSQQGLPKGNLTVILLETLVKKYGGISKGEGMRLQPYCNSPIPLKAIYQGQQLLFDFINYANKSSNCDMAKAMEMIEKIHYVGGLGAQHIMCVLTLLRVVFNTTYVRSTILLETNSTAKKIQLEYALNPKLTNDLYDELAYDSYNGSSRVVENMVCEFFRDIKEPTKTDWNYYSYVASIKKRKEKKPDTFFSNQSIFVEKNFSIYRFFYDKEGKVCSQNMNILELPQDKDRDWHLGTENIEDKVISVKRVQKISEKHKNTNHLPQDIISDTDEENIYDNKMSSTNDLHFLQHTLKKYSGIQKEILTMYMKNVADWQEKDAMDHADLNWFDGFHKFINTDFLLHQIAGIGKKRKRTKVQKYLSDIQHKVSSEKTVYSKSINGQNCVHYVHSSNENICQRGFYSMYGKRISGCNNCLAFYKSKDDAKFALKMVMFAGKIPNIKSHSDISRLLKDLEDERHIALFERIDGKVIFFGFVSKKREKVILNIPINENQPLKGIWQEFYVL